MDLLDKGLLNDVLPRIVDLSLWLQKEFNKGLIA